MAEIATLARPYAEALFKAAGFKPVRRSLNQAPFYFSRLIDFERV